MLTPCANWAERLSAYLDNELDVKGRAQVEDHLTHCADCRAATELFRCDAQDTTAALKARGAGAGFADKVMAQVAVTAIAGNAGAPAAGKAESPAAMRIDNSLPPTNKKPRSSFGTLLEWLFVTAIIAVLAAVMFPVFAKSREKARQTACLNNQRQLVLALTIYAQDHDEVLPPAVNWLALVKVDKQTLICPVAKSVFPAYAYNIAIAGQAIGQVADPVNTIATFDALNGMPAYRHNGGIVCSYLDGHVMLVPRPGEEARTNVKSPSPKPVGQRHTVVAPNINPMLDTGSSKKMNPMRPKPQPTIAPPDKNYGLAPKLEFAYQAAVALENEDVQGALEQTELAFQRFDGFVLTSNFQRGSEKAPGTATVTGRVPTEKLGELLVELGSFGKLLSRTVNGEDLTVTHMEQLKTLEDLAGAQKNLATLRDQTSDSDVASTLESQRNDARQKANATRIEEYKLKNRERLAEVTVQITGVKPPAPRVNPSFDSAAKSLGALLTFAGWLLNAIVIPLFIWLPIWGPVLGVVLWWRKRKIG